MGERRGKVTGFPQCFAARGREDSDSWSAGRDLLTLQGCEVSPTNCCPQRLHCIAMAATSGDVRSGMSALL